MFANGWQVHRSLGLDPVHALQWVAALDKACGLKISSPEIVRQVLQNLSTIALAVSAHLAGNSNAPDKL